MSLSNFLELELLDHVFKQTVYAVPDRVAIALSTADPSEAGTNIAEPAAGAYTRVKCLTTGADWNVAAAGAMDNASIFTFPTATASWGTITHFALYDATGTGLGNMLGYAALTTARDVTIGDTVKFAAGDLDISMT